jgi:hypothetical protein
MKRRVSGRSGTGAYTYRRNRSILLATTNRCALCGHGGAQTADHIIDDRRWPRDRYGKRVPGFDDLSNLQPAHGTMGGRQPDNPCPVCGLLCNQVKGARPARRPQTRVWLPDV